MATDLEYNSLDVFVETQKFKVLMRFYFCFTTIFTNLFALEKW